MADTKDKRIPDSVALPDHARAAGEFVDTAGRKWVAGEIVENRAPLLDPDAIKKDGGDPRAFNLPTGELYQVPGASNESLPVVVKGERGRGGSDAKARAGGKARGGAKRKGGR